MKRAMDELLRVDSRLYTEANKPEDPRVRTQAEIDLIKSMSASESRTAEARIRGLFPRELRIPTDTPSKTGWKYEWKPYPRPL